MSSRHARRARQPARKNRCRDLRLDALYAVYPGDRRYTLAERIEAVPLAALVPAK